jgi:phospholipase/lecithinase/hemolysin
MSEGACLIVQPTPTIAPPSGVALVSNLDRTVARRAGCTYTTVLAHLWSSPAAGEKRGLVLIDGIHPTAAGCKLMARTLAPVIARMIRARPRSRVADSAAGARARSSLRRRAKARTPPRG